MSDTTAIFQSSLIHSSLGMLILGGSGKIRFTNRAFKVQLGRQESELLGEDFVSFLDGQGRAVFLKNFAKLVKGETLSFKQEVRYLSSDPGIHWCRLNVNLMPHPEKTSWIIVVSFEDITAQKSLVDKLQRSSEEAERAREEAEKATRTKSEFLANMSHEIRTPIHTIIGMTELLTETRLDEEQQEYAEQIQFSADVLLSLINDILDFEKIEAGKLKLETLAIDLYEVLENAVDLVTLEAHRKGLEVILEITPEVPNLVEGDPVRLRQILVNLVNNATKFTSKGQIHVRVSTREVTPEGTILFFEVSDTGIGIPAEKQQKLFREFSQVDSSTTRKYGGTGLGLSISKRLSELMGGRIGVQSVEGEGSTFWFTIKVKPRGEGSSYTSMKNHFSGHQVLVVDDNRVSRGVIARYLAEWGCGVDTIEDGQEGLDRLEAAAKEGNPYHHCFVDLVMPGMDGWHFASLVMGREDLSGTSLFLMSPAGRGTIETKMKLLRWFSAYLDKPVKKHKLFEALKSATEKPEETEAADQPWILPGEENTNFASGHVLVAEDHEVNQQLFRTILQNLGQMVHLAGNGLEAVEAVKQSRFDVIFMDVQMPEMNGYEASTEIRRLGVKAPIVAVTASAIKGEREKCLESGMSDFLTKPFKKKDIVEALKKYLPAVTPASLASTKRDSDASDEEWEELEELEAVDLDDQDADLPTVDSILAEGRTEGDGGTEEAPEEFLSEESGSEEPLDDTMEEVSLEGIGGFYDDLEGEDVSEVELLEDDESLDEADAVDEMEEFDEVEDIDELEELDELEEGEELDEAGELDEVEEMEEPLGAQPFKAVDTLENADDFEELVVEEYDSDLLTTQGDDSPPPLPVEAEPVDPKLVFDWDEALDTFMGNEEVVRNVLSVQVEKVAGQLPRIEQAIREGNWEQLREEAHSIKGGSWNLQARELGDKAFVLEMAGRDSDAAAAEEGYPLLVAAYERFSRRVGEILGNT